jgi:hypothetical protein
MSFWEVSFFTEIALAVHFCLGPVWRAPRALPSTAGDATEEDDTKDWNTASPLYVYGAIGLAGRLQVLLASDLGN